MSIVFAVLAMLALSIKVLNMFDRDPETPDVVSATSGASGVTSADALAGEITGQQVAAIAVALTLSEQDSSPVPGPTGSQPLAGQSTGSWLQSGRMRSLGSALNPMRRRGQ